ncbi:general substrate transporter [Dentipellis sp. KUC8613]|nr:general substrate transporter [Dentipellis sp. KUC8613]
MSSAMEPRRESLFQNIRVYWLAFIAYWGIVLFGYDTGVAGGVVNSTYFQIEFGMRPASGPFNQHTIDNFSSNVVSVLQGGAFFGALGSAPMSAYIGRRWTLIVFTLIFTLGAILQTVAGGSRGLGYIYGGRVVAGVGIGGISAIAPAYVSECSPKNVRGRITGCFQIMVATGVMISYFINYGISLHIQNSPLIWRVPFGFQLVPAGIMAIGLLTVHESPRWLASVGRKDAAQRNLAIYRRLPVGDHRILAELAEIEAAIEEERIARADLGFKEAFLGKGNWIRFAIAFWIFFLQQWCGQNSVNYYTPQIFASIGYSSSTSSLLASGIYGIVKLVATTLFIFFLVETLGRKKSLFISAMGMGILFFIVGALLKEFPPPAVPTGTPPKASKAMAAMIYIYVVFYSMGWGPLPWVYVSDIFPTRTRHYGLALASASQWLWNFVVSKVTPTIHTNLGYKMFLMFAALNIGAMATFSLCVLIRVLLAPYRY